MLSFFNRKQAGSLTGIVPGNDGFAIASVERNGGEKPLLQGCSFRTDTLSGEQGLDRQPCSTLLSIGDYQLLVVDAPEVPPEEMRAAIRWRIRELIDFHIDDAVLDIFDAPPGGPANSKQLYVVVAHRDTVRQRIDALEQDGVRLEYIDIPELAMRNIAACLPEDGDGYLVPVEPGPGANPRDFVINRMTVQLRYRWQIAPLSDLFVDYTRGSNVPYNTLDDDFGDLFYDALTDPVIDYFVVKLRYRFGM